MHVTGSGVSLDLERHGDTVDAILLGDLDAADPETVERVVAALREAGATRLVSDHPPTSLVTLPAAVAAAAGAGAPRTIWQLRVALPLAEDLPARADAPAITARPFDPERDADAWVRANNRSFASHPDQGQQTAATLAATLAEPWVDLAGFLVVDDPERPGELAGSCWTRVHPATDAAPAIGEIFVIGIDPSQRGRRLGAALTLAGLDHLADGGLDAALLYVDDDNRPARQLYERLGFVPFRRRLVHTLGSVP